MGSGDPWDNWEREMQRRMRDRQQTAGRLLLGKLSHSIQGLSFSVWECWGSVDPSKQRNTILLPKVWKIGSRKLQWRQVRQFHSHVRKACFVKRKESNVNPTAWAWDSKMFFVTRRRQTELCLSELLWQCFAALRELWDGWQAPIHRLAQCFMVVAPTGKDTEDLLWSIHGDVCPKTKWRESRDPPVFSFPGV